MLRSYARMRRSALAISVIATFAVILLGVLQGILIAVVLSILLFFRRSWWPHGEVLGRVAELGGGTTSVAIPRPSASRAW